MASASSCFNRGMVGGMVSYVAMETQNPKIRILENNFVDCSITSDIVRWIMEFGGFEIVVISQRMNDFIWV